MPGRLLNKPKYIRQQVEYDRLMSNLDLSIKELHKIDSHPNSQYMNQFKTIHQQKINNIRNLVQLEPICWENVKKKQVM